MVWGSFWWCTWWKWWSHQHLVPCFPQIPNLYKHTIILCCQICFEVCICHLGIYPQSTHNLKKPKIKNIVNVKLSSYRSKEDHSRLHRHLPPCFLPIPHLYKNTSILCCQICCEIFATWAFMAWKCLSIHIWILKIPEYVCNHYNIKSAYSNDRFQICWFW